MYTMEEILTPDLSSSTFAAKPEGQHTSCVCIGLEVSKGRQECQL